MVPIQNLPECQQDLDPESLSKQFFNPSGSDYEINYYLIVPD